MMQVSVRGEHHGRLECLVLFSLETVSETSPFKVAHSLTATYVHVCGDIARYEGEMVSFLPHRQVLQ